MAGDGHAGTWVVVYVGVRAQNPRDSGGIPGGIPGVSGGIPRGIPGVSGGFL